MPSARDLYVDHDLTALICYKNIEAVIVSKSFNLASNYTQTLKY